MPGKINRGQRKCVPGTPYTATAICEMAAQSTITSSVVSTVKYDKTGRGWGRNDIHYACEERQGNCTDFHAIFIG